MSIRRVTAVVGMGLTWLSLACSGGSSDSTGGTPTTPPAYQPGSVQGTVADSTGAGVAGASLSLSATGQNTQAATSGSDGKYAFSQVTPGSWTLTLTPPTGFNAPAQSAVTVSVTASHASTVDFTVVKPVVTPPPPTSDGTVTISGFAFSPASVTVQSGATVTFTNKDATTHTATADDGSFDTGNISTNGSKSVTFTHAGTFTYHCAIHPAMTATIVVQ